jgi:hypothetical protein
MAKKKAKPKPKRTPLPPLSRHMAELMKTRAWQEAVAEMAAHDADSIPRSRKMMGAMPPKKKK